MVSWRICTWGHSSTLTEYGGVEPWHPTNASVAWCMGSACHMGCGLTEQAGAVPWHPLNSGAVSHAAWLPRLTCSWTLAGWDWCMLQGRLLDPAVEVHRGWHCGAVSRVSSHADNAVACPCMPPMAWISACLGDACCRSCRPHCPCHSITTIFLKTTTGAGLHRQHGGCHPVRPLVCGQGSGSCAPAGPQGLSCVLPKPEARWQSMCRLSTPLGFSCCSRICSRN